jgi:hypothetical protein
MGTTWEKVESIAAEAGAKFPRLVAAQWMRDLRAKQFEDDESTEEWVKGAITEAHQEAETLKEAAVAAAPDIHHAETLVRIVEAYVEVEE